MINTRCLNENLLNTLEDTDCETVMRRKKLGSSLVVHWLGLGSFTAVAQGSILGREAKIPQAWPKKDKKEERMKTARSTCGNYN